MPQDHTAEGLARHWIAGDKIKQWQGDAITPSNDGDYMHIAYSVYNGGSGAIACKTATDQFYAFNTDCEGAPYAGQATSSVGRALGRFSIPVSFSSLIKAGINPHEIEIKYCKRLKPSYWYNTEDITRVLFMHDGKLFMNMADDAWRGIVLVKGNPLTWEKAFSKYIPKAVVLWEKATGFTARRQGEWYAIPKPDLKIPSSKVEKNVMLPHGDHKATRLAVVDGKMYVKGTLRHKSGEEKRSSWYRRIARPWLKMGSYWHEVHKANFKEAY